MGEKSGYTQQWNCTTPSSTVWQELAAAPSSDDSSGSQLNAEAADPDAKSSVRQIALTAFDEHLMGGNQLMGNN